MSAMSADAAVPTGTVEARTVEARSVEAGAVEVLLTELRRRGQRITTGRRAIVEVVAGHGGLSAEEIARRVQRTHPDVHASTVYRTLETLEEADLLRHVHLGHGPARWQLAGDPYHHLVCEACDAVQLVPRAFFDDVRARVRDEYGFAIAFQHFATIGRCASCASDGAGEGGERGAGERGEVVG